MQKFIYFFLLAIFVLIPVIINNKRNGSYLLKIKYLFPAMVFAAAVFSIWVIRFAELGIWSFNPHFVSGLFIRNLPAEEWLFFFVMPFFSVFIYDYLKEREIRYLTDNIYVGISLVLLVFFGAMAFFFRKELYTFFTFFLLTVYFGYTIFRNNFKRNYPYFYLSYIAALVPFFVLRLVITSLPVISFDIQHILNVRIFSVPVEDAGYFFLMHLMNVTIFEYLFRRQFY